MSRTNKTAFIVEGKREEKLLNRLINILPNNAIPDVMLILPAEMNIYMLWNDIKDDPNLDVISYLIEKSESIKKKLDTMNSDDFGEIYLFFDLDAQQDNIKCKNKEEFIKIIHSMLNTFDNETDKGKMYISYPMCEAYSDYIVGTCKTFTSCCFQDPFNKNYKNNVGTSNKNVILTHLNIDKIKEMIICYLDRISCLYDSNNVFDYLKAKEISTQDIFKLQSKLLRKELIMVISVFPEFIIDYYKLNVLNKIFPIINSYYKVGCEDRIRATIL